jgi:hypothetical protein
MGPTTNDETAVLPANEHASAIELLVDAFHDNPAHVYIAPSGRRACLATQRPENVTFYQRLGFEVTSEEHVGQGPHAFTNWVMVSTR